MEISFPIININKGNKTNDDNDDEYKSITVSIVGVMVIKK